MSQSQQVLEKPEIYNANDKPQVRIPVNDDTTAVEALLDIGLVPDIQQQFNNLTTNATTILYEFHLLQCLI